jgi:flagellar hook assembly protein FlgD
MPAEYSLSQNYPNPFNPSTTIEFALPQGGNVIIKIYNMLGQEIKTLYSGQMESGRHRVMWDGMNNAGQKMGSGNYIYRLISGDFTESKKMILLK